MRLLLDRGIGISFLTKGFIPSEFIELFKKHPNLIKARVGLVSLNENYIRLFEPLSAHPFKRLLNIRNLINAGVDTAIRIDPIIPISLKGGEGRFLEGSIEQLIKRLSIAGVMNITLSSLIMRASIINQFIKELPLKIAKNILRLYNGQPYQRIITSARTRLLPKSIRIIQYDSIKCVAKKYGIECHICGCKNPDLPWEFCNPWF